MWTARELEGDVTADLTTPQRVRREHSTGIKKKENKKTPKKPKTKLKTNCNFANL